MNDPKVQGQEPTMEEILASIRRIISEGEDPNAAAPAPKPAPPRPAPAPDGILELTDMVGADGKVVNLAAAKAAPPPVNEEYPPMVEPTEPPAAQTPEMPADDVVLTSADSDPTPAPAAPPAFNDEALIGAATAAASTAAFAALAKSMQRDPSPLASSIPIGSGRTLEELVAEMIRPMLRDWLDANLPGVIERMVQREIERIVRRAED